MKRNTTNVILAALLALALALLAGCGGAASVPGEEQKAEAAQGADSSPYTGNFAGEVPGTNAFVAVVVDNDNHALAYVCDGRGGEGGEPFEWSVTEWFTGAVAQDGSLDLTSAGGASLSAEVTGDRRHAEFRGRGSCLHGCVRRRG